MIWKIFGAIVLLIILIFGVLWFFGILAVHKVYDSSQIYTKDINYAKVSFDLNKGEAGVWQTVYFGTFMHTNCNLWSGCNLWVQNIFQFSRKFISLSKDCYLSLKSNTWIQGDYYKMECSDPAGRIIFSAEYTKSNPHAPEYEINNLTNNGYQLPTTENPRIKIKR